LQAPAALAATTTTSAGESTPLNLDQPAKAVEHGTGGGGIVRTIVGLAVVIGVILGLHWILKQVKTGREQRSTGGGLKTLSTLQLGPGRALHLVRSGSEIVLLGSAEHGVTPIRVYSEEEARALGLLDELDGFGAATGARPDPMQAAPGSPAPLRDLLRSVQRLTVRR
ncbi:MAG: FliO/MopB family protein, partial [Solirubrobacteraceae bacterium]